MREEMLSWGPLCQILALQRDDGSFQSPLERSSSAPTFVAACLMERCGMDSRDEPIKRALAYLSERHVGNGAFSHNTGGSGILPCNVGKVTRALMRMVGYYVLAVRDSITWILDHQRFDHKETRAGGGKQWSFRSVVNYGCWQSVSCYHGVIGTMRTLAAIPPQSRSREVKSRLRDAAEYLRIHRVFKRSSVDKPLFRHMTQFFLNGGYRFHLIDVLEGLADMEPRLILEEWVSEAVDVVDSLAVDGKITLVKNYRTFLIDPLEWETVGEPARFLTYQWLMVKKKFGT